MSDIYGKAAAILRNPGTVSEASNGARRITTPLLDRMRSLAAMSGVLCMASLAACTQAPSMGNSPFFGMQQQINGVVGEGMGRRIGTAIGLPVSPDHPTFKGAATTPGQQRLLHALANVDIGTPIVYRDPQDHSRFENITVIRQGLDANGRQCREFQSERDGRIRAGIVCRVHGELTLSQVEIVNGASMIVEAQEPEASVLRMG